jgi:hypothetical protein
MFCYSPLCGGCRKLRKNVRQEIKNFFQIGALYIDGRVDHSQLATPPEFGEDEQPPIKQNYYEII